MVTRIKFCGFTEIDDVNEAVDLGVNFIGFVRHPESNRYICLEDAEYLSLDSHEACCVLVYQSCHESPMPKGFIVQAEEFDSWTPRSPNPWLVAVRIGVSSVITRVPQNLQRFENDLRILGRVRKSVLGVLLDASVPGLAGGSGMKIDWDWAAKYVEQSPLKVFLAGGLTPDNVAEAIRIVRPYAVDVSSGIESSPGIKDHGKMRAFVEAVRSTD